MLNIYKKELLENEHDSFHFNPKGYDKIKGVYLIGSAEISLCVKNGKKIQFSGLDTSTAKDLAPNERLLNFKKSIEAEQIQGTIIKTEIEGISSIYLLLE